MADTQPLAPTDAEIWHLWAPMAQKGVADPVDFARAVLAKWGAQPLPASHGDALLAATGTALEVLQKHRQMKGDWPMGELGRRAAEELQAARYVIFNTARATTRCCCRE